MRQPHDRGDEHVEALLLGLDVVGLEGQSFAEAGVVDRARRPGLGQVALDVARLLRVGEIGRQHLAGTPYAEERSADTCSSRALSRETSTRSCPSAASAVAKAWPMPAVGPVMRATGTGPAFQTPSTGTDPVLTRTDSPMSTRASTASARADRGDGRGGTMTADDHHPCHRQPKGWRREDHDRGLPRDCAGRQRPPRPAGRPRSAVVPDLLARHRPRERWTSRSTRSCCGRPRPPT